ncbi:MAG: alpha/beta hydrolase [Bacteroidetes bacterium]|nr:alpha/beta hydrolase [Bacteroidota bacterium]HET6245563.1 alpha/beta hydrolase [Bacteroidia bacterium]
MIKNLAFKNAPVRVIDKGRGRALVFLHGFLESSDIWKEFVDPLSLKYRVICIDLPGHGQTGCLGYVHSMDLMAECVQSVLKQLRVKKSILIGHSMGGYVAMAYAEFFPENVKGLCLFHSSAAADNQIKKQERERVINLIKQSKKDFVKNLIPGLFTKENQKKHSKEIKLLIKRAGKISKQGIIASLEGMKERVEREIILRFSTYPVLFIIGKQDPVIPFEVIVEQAELPRNATTYILDSVAHMGFIEAKDQTIEIIAGFAKKAFSGKVHGKRKANT